MVGSASDDGGAYRPGAGQAGVAVPSGPDRAVDGPGAPERGRTGLVWGAAAGIVAAVAIMVAVSLAGPSLSVVTMPKPAAGPPWWIWRHPSAARLTFALWAAVAAGGIG